MTRKSKNAKPKHQDEKKKGKSPQAGRKSCLGDAACQYLCALTNPFDGPIVGLPASAAVGFPKTRKMRLWIRGSFGVIASGNGFITMVPDLFIANDISATGFVYPVTSTDGTVTKAAITNIIVAGIVGANSNSPFTYANFTTGDLDLAYRVVAAGLRWQNTTAALYRAGTESALASPTGSTLINDNAAELNAFEACRKYHGTDKGWRTIIWKPSHPCDFELKTFDDIGTGGENIYNTPPYSNLSLGVVINNLTTQAQTYDYEACVVIEFAGAAVGPMGLTSTKIDPLGSAAVQQAVSSAPPQLLMSAAAVPILSLSAEKTVSESSGVMMPYNKNRDWLSEAESLLTAVGATAVEIGALASLFL